MPAGRRGVALWAALVRATVRRAAVAYGISAGDHAVLARASLAKVIGWRQCVAVVDFAALEPAACAGVKARIKALKEL